jgi:excisionase family DNA binding protein
MAKTAVPSERDQARAALKALADRPSRFRLPSGKTVVLPKSAVNGLVDLLSAVAAGDEAEVVHKDREITTQQAAELLGMSRPTVIKLIEEGELRASARRVGTHRRLRVRDVLAFRERELERRRQILDEMTREAEELGLYE